MNLPNYHPFRSEPARAEYHALVAQRAEYWPVPGETRLIDTPSGQTYLRVNGPVDGAPMILLPGSRGTSLTWIPNIARLSVDYRTYAVDSIYDYGLSIRRRKLQKAEHLVAWLAEVLDVLEAENPVTLVGLSYGGWLASQFAKQYPERVRSLVINAPAATVLPVSAALIGRAMLTLLPFQRFRKQFYYWLLNDSVQSGAAGRSAVDEAVADWTVAERCFAPLPLINASVLTDQELQRFSVPTLFLVGENEKIYSAQRAVKRLNRVAPQIKAEIIPRAGHDLTFIQADLVTEKVLEFLSNSSKRGSL